MAIKAWHLSRVDNVDMVLCCTSYLTISTGGCGSTGLGKLMGTLPNTHGVVPKRKRIENA